MFSLTYQSKSAQKEEEGMLLSIQLRKLASVRQRVYWKPLGNACAFHGNATASERLHPDPFILSIVKCPLSKADVFYDPNVREVISLTAKFAYPVHDNGVINFCPHDARLLRPEELTKYSTTNNQ